MKTVGAPVEDAHGFGCGEFPDADARARACDHPGCAEEGHYRAPRARDRLNDYYWFCLDHVRAYNAGWDYYAGMTPEQIEQEVRRDTTWQRPTWPMGTKGLEANHFRPRGVHDPLGALDEDAPFEASPARRRTPRETAAMAVLGVGDPLTVIDLKARYKELVKQHHPDANGGDPSSEERFKEINNAYTTLLAALEPPAQC